MKISYNKLWKLLIDKKLKKKDLCKMAEISDATMAKLGKGANVNTEIIVKICKALDCDISDIMEIETDSKMEKKEDIVIYNKNVRIEDFNIKQDGSFTLTFVTVEREKNIKIVINSDENTNHHRPHVHAFYDQKQYQISIDDNIEELNGNCDKFCRYIIKNHLKNCLQKCREKWNSINSSYKFDINEFGEYVCKGKVEE